MSPSSPILITIDSNEAARPEDRGSGRRKTGNQTVDGDKQIRDVSAQIYCGQRRHRGKDGGLDHQGQCGRDWSAEEVLHQAITEAWGGEGMNALKSILKENGWVAA